jgi:hypothetical protein
LEQVEQEHQLVLLLQEVVILLYFQLSHQQVEVEVVEMVQQEDLEDLEVEVVKAV